MDKEFISAKSFSKEKQQTERKKTAETIRAKRKEYFSQKESLQQGLQRLIAEAETKKLLAAEARAGIEEAENKIQQKSQNFIGRILQRYEIKRLQAKLGAEKINENTIIEELSDLDAAKLETKQSLKDRTALENIREELDGFYQKNEQAWNNYEEDREAGNVKNIMRQHDAFLVHAFINPTLSPSDVNGLIRKELSWRDKLDLLVLEPTLSASAVDTNHKETFAPVGVLLGDGQVQAASARDLGSYSTDVKGRATRHSSFFNQRLGEQISEALEPSNQQGWTEFVVANPKVAGLFFKVESDNTLGDLTFGSDTTISQVVEIARKRSLPLFAMKDGKFYAVTDEEASALGAMKTTRVTERAGLNIYDKTLQEKPKIELHEDRRLNATQAAELSPAINEQEKEAILERFMTDSPFQLHRVPEAQQIESRANGRALYHLYKESAKIDEKTTVKKKTTIPAYAAGNVDPIEVTILKIIPGPTHIEHYIELNDGTRAMWRESRNPVSKESRFRAGSLYHQDELITQDRTLEIGRMVLSAERPQTILDVINIARKGITDITGWLQKWERTGADVYADQSRLQLKNIAASLYGIAEEARSSGDEAMAELAQKAAEEIFPFQDYQAMIARRVSESGTFKISREELQGN